ncbi:MAG: hypothetical protein Q9212_005991 [Teloschistes hypoglaucus]
MLETRSKLPPNSTPALFNDNEAFSRSPLLELPPELRLQIYEHVLPTTIDLDSSTSYWIRGSISLLSTCQLIHKEAAECLYSRANFTVDVVSNSTTLNRRWLSRTSPIPKKRFQFPESIGETYLPLIKRFTISISHVGFQPMTRGWDHVRIAELAHYLRGQVHCLSMALENIPRIKQMNLLFRDNSQSTWCNPIILESMFNLRNIQSINISGDLDARTRQRLMACLTP